MTRYVPAWQVAARFPGYAPVDGFDGEVGMFAADEAFARAHGGPLTHTILDAIPRGYREAAARAGRELNIDIRIHRLGPGQYPASPGWHCDAEEREVAFDAAAATQTVAHSLVGTISTHPEGVSTTEFLDQALDIPTPKHLTGFDLWAHVDAHINQLSPLPTTRAADGQLTAFSTTTLHRATAATRAGTRLFARISQWTPPPGHEPGLARFEQTYRIC